MSPNQIRAIVNPWHRNEPKTYSSASVSPPHIYPLLSSPFVLLSWIYQIWSVVHTFGCLDNVDDAFAIILRIRMRIQFQFQVQNSNASNKNIQGKHLRPATDLRSPEYHPAPENSHTPAQLCRNIIQPTSSSILRTKTFAFCDDLRLDCLSTIQRESGSRCGAYLVPMHGCASRNTAHSSCLPAEI